MSARFTRVAWRALLLLALPLAGVWLAGLPVARYLEFPPRVQYVEHAPFSWPVFIVLGAIEAALLVPLLFRVTGHRSPVTGHTFPRWGWFGLIGMAVSWTLAWTRFEWFAPLQAHTFTPLWLSYVVILNAFTHRRAGHCLMTRAPARFFAMFPLSACFWWYFEYLNRFVQNWNYEAVSHFSPLEYFLSATISFSTVLPAVMSTAECLQVHGLFDATPEFVMRIWHALSSRLLLTAAFACLLLMGVLPNYLFPLLWLAPLAFFQSLPVLNEVEGELSSRKVPTIACPERSRGGSPLRFAAAALICGFFWELWNFLSSARWVYAVPFVGRFHLFEMPILGYFGYLPFGWECAMLVQLALGAEVNPPENNLVQDG